MAEFGLWRIDGNRARTSRRKEALPGAQRERIDDQQDFIRKSMFEQLLDCATLELDQTFRVLRTSTLQAARFVTAASAGTGSFQK
jgi:hypothetical protein